MLCGLGRLCQQVPCNLLNFNPIYSDGLPHFIETTDKYWKYPFCFLRGRPPKYLEMTYMYDVSLKIVSLLANFSDADDASYGITSGFSLFAKVPISQNPE